MHAAAINAAGFDALNPEQDRRERRTSRTRIYVVDDDSAVRAALSMLVRTCGWDAVPCADAEEFLSCYAPGEGQCLIVDVRMPGLSGVELQQELNRRGDDLPVIVVTAHDDQPEAAQARAQGARAVLGKPFKDADLVRCIQQALAPA